MDGPFRKEFEVHQISVSIVPVTRIREIDNIKVIKECGMAICNTILTDEYSIICSQYIPTAWYIREATNIPDFIGDNFRRKYTIQHSQCIYCVSDYAAAAIEKYTDNKVHVIHNCVEDEINMGVGHISGSGKKVKFVQFGTIEYRKGYDVLLAAYKAMPKVYQDQSELYFAGGLIRSGAMYASYLLSEASKSEGVHNLGLITGEENKIRTLSAMDIVVVASRDESCSLVALEGAMLSKPLIVTENVGAKYMVGKDNGYVVNTGDVESLKQAMMSLIDRKQELKIMGQASREMYEKYASMNSYVKDMKELYSQTSFKNSLTFKKVKLRNRIMFSEKMIMKEREKEEKWKTWSANPVEHVVVSLTSHPGRINTVVKCLESLLSQESKPEKILLWLSLKQFPRKESDLPADLCELQAKNTQVFSICWVEEDIGPHKKYFYTMKKFPEYPVIIVDDDCIYDKSLVGNLMNNYRRFPQSILANRVNMIMFRENDELRQYSRWLKCYTMLRDTPSAQLMAVGCDGVLYPPHSLPPEAFNLDAILKTCCYCDDLWLKVMTLHNGYLTVFPSRVTKSIEIEGTRDTALWRMNVYGNNNDVSMKNILDYYNANLGSTQELLRKIRKDRAC